MYFLSVLEKECNLKCIRQTVRGQYQLWFSARGWKRLHPWVGEQRCSAPPLPPDPPGWEHCSFYSLTCSAEYLYATHWKKSWNSTDLIPGKDRCVLAFLTCDQWAAAARLHKPAANWGNAGGKKIQGKQVMLLGKQENFPTKCTLHS